MSSSSANRRRFLQYSSALCGGAPLLGCGGGEDAGAAPPEAGVTASATAPTAHVLAAGTATTALNTAFNAFAGQMQFGLLLGSSSTQLPFSLGFAFRKGDVPAGSSVVGNGTTVRMQVTPRSTWPDGSLKFAQISGLVGGAAGTTVMLPLTAGPAAAAAAVYTLSPADLRRTGISASFGASGLGSASFSGSDWDNPAQTWVSGPLMSSWIYRKPIGADKHLMAWLEVRLFANGAVEVLPWIENGWLRVAGPGNRKATYRFTLGGTQRFQADIDLPHHCRTPLVGGTTLSHWLADDPLVTPRHDLAYLQATELVPTYGARPSSAAAVVAGLAATFAPLQRGNFTYDGDSMPSPGYQSPIGLLPEHDVAYLTVDAPGTFAAVVRNGYSAGRYAIHYRDETTQRPLRFSSYPNLVLSSSASVKDTGGSTKSQYTPTPTGTGAPTWDVAHSPSVGYLAYLLTGRCYFMEEVQFSATVNYLTKSDNTAMRVGSQGLVQTAVDAWQTRSCAWDWRSLIQALTVTPDSDTALRQEFVACVENNIRFFHKTYVAQANNPFGWIMPGETYSGRTGTGAPWQQDFVTAVFGWSLAMGLPISSSVTPLLDAFFRWKARSAVMRLGSSKDFWYVNGDPYNLTVSPAAVPDYLGGKGPWLASDAAVYAATYANPPTWVGKLEGQLFGEIMPGERAMWGNLMPAIAYAVRHGVTGAASAYARLTSASNYPALRDAFNTAPVWSVVPTSRPVTTAPLVPLASGSLPAWLNGHGVGEWVEIAGTAGAGGAAVDAFSGMAVNEATGEIYIAAAGGHSDSPDNRVVSLNLLADAPRWTLRLAASTQVATNVAYYPDGKPASRHLYSSLHYVPQLGRVMTFGARATYGAAWDFSKVDGFNPGSNTWDPAGTWADIPAGYYGAASVRATGEVLSVGALKKWSPATRAWTTLATSTTGDPSRWPIACDSTRNLAFNLQWGDGQGYDPLRLVASVVPLAGGAQTAIRFNPSSALTQWLAEKPVYAGMDYDPTNDRFLFYSGQGAAAGRVYVIKPNASTTWDMSLLSVGAASARLPPSSTGGVNNRLRYIPALKGFVLLANASANLFFIRTA